LKNRILKTDEHEQILPSRRRRRRIDEAYDCPMLMGRWLTFDEESMKAVASYPCDQLQNTSLLLYGRCNLGTTIGEVERAEHNIWLSTDIGE
jgi:hypothetical protein